MFQTTFLIERTYIISCKKECRSFVLFSLSCKDDGFDFDKTNN